MFIFDINNRNINYRKGFETIRKSNYLKGFTYHISTSCATITSELNKYWTYKMV